MRKISPDLEVIVSRTPGNDGGEMTNMTEEGSVRFLFIWTDYFLTLARLLKFVVSFVVVFVENVQSRESVS